MRADERAALQAIQRDQNIRQGISSGVKKAAAIGTAATLGSTGILSEGIKKIAPFLNSFITSDLAVKGISKINPFLGNLLKKGQKMGLDIEEGLDFLKNKMNPESQEQEVNQQTQAAESNKPANENPIEAFAPELHNHLVQEVSKGKKPLEALHSAKGNQRLLSQVELVAKNLKNDLLDVLSRFYSPEVLGIADQSKTGLQGANALAQAFERVPPQQPPTTQPQAAPQMGKGEQALTAILQQINQRLGGNP